MFLIMGNAGFISSTVSLNHKAVLHAFKSRMGDRIFAWLDMHMYALKTVCRLEILTDMFGKRIHPKILNH